MKQLNQKVTILIGTEDLGNLINFTRTIPDINTAQFVEKKIKRPNQ